MSTTDIFDNLWNAPRGRRGFLLFDRRSGSVTIPGHRHGRTTVVGWTEVPGLGLVVSLHEEGATHWFARGQQASHGATTCTVLVDEFDRMLADEPTVRFVRLSSSVEVKNNAENRAESTIRFFDAMGV